MIALGNTHSLEVGLIGFQTKETDFRPLDMNKISFPTAFRLLKVWQAFKEGYSVEDIYNKTKIDPWFLYHFKLIANIDIKKLYNNGHLKFLKQEGFSDCSGERRGHFVDGVPLSTVHRSHRDHLTR